MSALPKSIRQLLRENLAEVVTIRVFALPVGVFFIFVINKHSQAIQMFIELIKNPISWIVWAAVSILDAILRAIYWYFRERNPKYIRKMEEIEKLRQAKEARHKDQMGQGGSE
jgi:fumarate reductase subunit C